MDDWDNEDFEPLPVELAKEVPKAQWGDEDVEEVKTNCKVVEKPRTESPSELKPEKKRNKANNVTSKDEPFSDPLTEKLRQRRLVEKADNRNVAALSPGHESKEGNTLEDFIPKSSNDFLTYADLVLDKIRPFEKSFHYMTLLKALVRHSVKNLTATHTKELASSIAVIANEKLRDAEAGRKQKGPKKKQLLVDKPDEDSYSPDAYDDIYDRDYM
ncbi:uncharacterized protein [Physcomitrium patens]|uniref:Uncharacterized protein n=1 Tax=Physcomitrium patens TaxID=3218 RepID=A0A2K1IG42_PHYPA|nr:eukaryotic translation initiation factor 3 subunit J-B-like [Physcomitrium patens]XP_024364291.1 eukaryotic translation initiation factor 3 subunit J-B-like [Physcomitrium patens]XP_024364292.1 eukaryotic translation initiation factor 3 subunit J-B-like [Physcomitrium patens]XP_024364293.1 eukaryotic translation initiation factor 3 subunit J-B-like [Physcomitrium patens]PNR28245.1 hypothetical protein PHYPA_028837 [Physcomitrium patens]|eukprot:XP_024364290.1 eukaryotic translation initiation factor 3 subunit J-B-like [Physcomitrella patens]